MTFFILKQEYNLNRKKFALLQVQVNTIPMKIILHLFLLILSLSSCTNHTSQNLQPFDEKSSWFFSDFQKVDSINPILTPSSSIKFTCPVMNEDVNWEERNVLNPSAVVKDGKVYLLYRAQDKGGTSRIGVAVSNDGLHFEKMPEPVFYPDNDSMKVYEWNKRKGDDFVYKADCKSCYFDGVEDPRIIESEEGLYVMTYTAYDGETARMSLATSKDLLSWKKYGPILSDEKHKNTWSKSGAIVVEQTEDKIVAKKINGKYWMYFGDTNLFMATSEDLIHWNILENEENGNMISVLHSRPGYFDSRLVEPGPFALYGEGGINLIYNASNAANLNDAEIPKFTYAAGQALFQKDKPYKLIDRTDSYFIHPDKDYEKTGEVNEVCFVEGLVHFQGKWFLYYGTADSRIAVAVNTY